MAPFEIVCALKGRQILWKSLASIAALTLTGSALPQVPRIAIVAAGHDREERGTGLWRPTMIQAAAAREALRKFLTAEKTVNDGRWERQRSEVARNFNSYVLQIEGVRKPTGNRFYDSDGNGPRQIHIDGFCPQIVEEVGDRINREQLIVYDGGSCIFQAMYDVRTGTITFFQANGLA
jgi:hypothetical protein